MIRTAGRAYALAHPVAHQLGVQGGAIRALGGHVVWPRLTHCNESIVDGVDGAVVAVALRLRMRRSVLTLAREGLSTLLVHGLQPCHDSAANLAGTGPR